MEIRLRPKGARDLLPTDILPNHPFYGMCRFKAGFGGKTVHGSGSWDLSLDDAHYRKYRNAEALGITLP